MSTILNWESYKSSETRVSRREQSSGGVCFERLPAPQHTANNEKSLLVQFLQVVHYCNRSFPRTLSSQLMQHCNFANLGQHALCRYLLVQHSALRIPFVFSSDVFDVLRNMKLINFFRRLQHSLVRLIRPSLFKFLVPYGPLLKSIYIT